jgi:hypothetical protein
MRIKVHPDVLKRKNPSMSETEKTAIDEHAKKVGGAAEILLDSTKVSFSFSPRSFELVLTKRYSA